MAITKKIRTRLREWSFHVLSVGGVGGIGLVLWAVLGLSAFAQQQDVYNFQDTDGDGNHWRILSHTDNLQIDYSDTYADVVRFNKDRSTTFSGHVLLDRAKPRLILRNQSLQRWSNAMLRLETEGTAGQEMYSVFAARDGEGEGNGNADFVIRKSVQGTYWMNLFRIEGESGDLIFNQNRSSDSPGYGNLIVKQGNLGIGTTNPKKALHVAGNLVLNGTGSDVGVASGEAIQFVEWNSTWSGFTEHMRIMPSGKVGIGTTNPTKELTVDGHIGATEVVVQPEWSDFVFEEGYELPTLKEVKAHIEKKGHLPDIPSAGEVERNGVRLGEMDAKLLKKIEELTLYAIEQQEQNRALQQQVAEQQRQLDAQQREIDQLKQMIEALEGEER